MKLARVVGTVTATEKHGDFHGLKLLLCQPLDENDAVIGTPVIAVDTVQAGVGDHVLVLKEGGSVRQILGKTKLAIRSAVVGIVDAVDIDDETGIPSHDSDTMETNVPGIYIAGVLAAGYNANKIFIENGKFHGPKIVEAVSAG